MVEQDGKEEQAIWCPKLLYLKHKQEVTHGAAGRVELSLQILHLLYLSKEMIKT